MSAIEDFWSCYNCGCLSDRCDHDEEDEEVCPVCGCHAGDGFGMAMNDPACRGLSAQELAQRIVGEGGGE